LPEPGSGRRGYARGVDIGFMYRAADNSLVNDIILRLS
jgi:hypothetical protein